MNGPHIGYVTRDEWEVHFADVFDQINAHDTGTPVNVVNPDVLAHALDLLHRRRMRSEQCYAPQLGPVRPQGAAWVARSCR